jgi:hypothetical protein
VIDDAFKERDPQRHCAMKGLPGRVSILEKPFSENLVLKHSCCPHVFVDFSIVCQDTGCIKKTATSEFPKKSTLF